MTRRLLVALLAVPLLAVPPAIGVMLTAGSDGGGQWGPRYLLPAVPFLLVLVVDAMGALGRRFERTIIWLGFATIVIGLVTGRAAWCCRPPRHATC